MRGRAGRVGYAYRSTNKDGGCSPSGPQRRCSGRSGLNLIICNLRRLIPRSAGF